MLSVILINSDIYERYQKYAYFFNWFEDNSNVEICVWNKDVSPEASIDELAPQLFDIVKSVPEWNAYIVDEPFVSSQYIKDDFANRTQYSLNPYERSRGAKDYSPEADTLLHLVYFLGGRGIESLDYLTDYTFRAARPTHIFLLTPRIFEGMEMQRSFLRNEIEEEYRLASQDMFSLMSANGEVLRPSDFWSRYEYPPNCRFLVFDMPDTENVKYEDSWFMFWLSVMTMVLNSYGSDELGAFKLYCLHINISAETFERFLNKFYTALSEASEISEKEIENQISAIKAAQEDTSTSHPVECAPVYVTFPDTDFSKFYPDNKQFGVTKDRPMMDYDVWNEHKKEVKTETHRLFKAISRGKNEAVDAMNRTLVMDLPSLTNRTLTRYDAEDIRDALDRDELDMLKLNCGLAPSRVAFEEIEHTASRKVESSMRPRLKRSTFLGVAGLGIGVCLAGFIPFIISSATFNLTSFMMALLITTFAGVAVGFAAYLALRTKRTAFGYGLDDYSKEVSGCLKVIQDNSQVQSKYLSMLLNYMEKYQMLRSCRVDRRQMDRLEQLTKNRSNFEDAIAQCRSIAGLCDVKLRLLEIKGEDDVMILEPGKKIYLHEETDLLRIPLNNAKDRLVPPFRFVETLGIKEETVYESSLYYGAYRDGEGAEADAARDKKGATE